MRRQADERKGASRAESTAPKTLSVHRFVPRNVLPGDILLTKVPFKLLDTSTYGSLAIRMSTQAPFSHAALCIEPGLMIEAVGTGVARLAFGAAGVRNSKNVKLLRLGLEVPNGLEFARRAAFHGHQYLSRGYSISGALGARVAPLRKPSRGDLFCSQLVARAYSEAGCPLLERKKPEQIAPGDLLRSSLLKDVTAYALIEVEVDQPFDLYLDESSRFERLGQWEVRTKLAILRSAPVVDRLKALEQCPESFFELEKLLRICDSPNLDIAVHGELTSRSFDDAYIKKALAAADLSEIDDIHRAEFAGRFVAPPAHLQQLDEKSLRLQILDAESNILSFHNDIEARRNDIETWRRYRTTSNERTFSYLETLQQRLLPISQRILELSEMELQALKEEEVRRRTAARADPPHP